MKRNCDRKRAYTKPTMRVYELQQRALLMTSGTAETEGAVNVIYEEEDI